MMLAPDSSFFKFFGDPGKAVVPAGAMSQIPAQPEVAPVPDVIPPSDATITAPDIDATPTGVAPTVAVPAATAPAAPAATN
jgi:hypothetical protein